MNDEEEIKMGFSGFHTIANSRYEGFDDRMLRDFEIMVHKLAKTDELSKIANFFSELNQHVFHDTSAHPLTIYNFEEEVLTDIYHTFREAGFNGSMDDMLLAIYKDIDVGSVADCLAGWNRTKAIPVPGWLAMFKKHETKSNVHANFVGAISVDSSPNYPPNKYISEFIHASMVETDTWYDVKGCRNDEVTICVKFSYDFRPNELYGKQEFPLMTFQLENEDQIEIVVEAEKTNIGHNGKVRCRNERTGEFLELNLPFHEFGRERLVICYADDMMSMKDPLSGVKGESLFASSLIKKVKFHSEVSVGQVPHQPPYTVIRELYQYNRVMSLAEQNFFINI